MSNRFDFHAIANQVFSQLERGELSDFATREWAYCKDAISTTLEQGWDNETFPWDRAMQNFWRYPLSFCGYAIPSLVMIDQARFNEAAECLRSIILLLKDTPVWDGWVRKRQGPDPICCKNIMYKGHLNLLYGLYQLMTGSCEFEAQFKQLTQIVANEYRYNGQFRNFWAIECEDDQVFAPCNSQGVLSLLVYDRIYGTDVYERFGANVTRFMREHMSDPDSKLYFMKYHPSHDQAEAYLGGAFNVWPLTQMHVTDPAACEEAYQNLKRLLIEDCGDGTAYLKECSFAAEPAMGLEEGLGILYVPGLAREYDDAQLWEKVVRYMAVQDGLVARGDRTRLTAVAPAEEPYIQCYLFWGAVHCGWKAVLDYDWELLPARKGGHRG